MKYLFLNVLLMRVFILFIYFFSEIRNYALFLNKGCQLLLRTLYSVHTFWFLRTVLFLEHKPALSFTLKKICIKAFHSVRSLFCVSFGVCLFHTFIVYTASCVSTCTASCKLEYQLLSCSLSVLCLFIILFLNPVFMIKHL